MFSRLYNLSMKDGESFHNVEQIDVLKIQKLMTGNTYTPCPVSARIHGSGSGSKSRPTAWARVLIVDQSTARAL